MNEEKVQTTEATQPRAQSGGRRITKGVPESAARTLRWMNSQLACPNCWEQGMVIRKAAPEEARAFATALGGPFLPMLLEHARKPRYFCQRCRLEYSAHTRASAFFLAVVFLFVGTALSNLVLALMSLCD